MPKRKSYTKKTDSKKAWSKYQRKSTVISLESKASNKSFYIVCEGENTEPEYFKSFPLATANVESYGLGQTQTKLVESFVGIKSELKDDKIREFWCVFDMDIDLEKKANQKQDFNNAIELATKNNIKVAYSNDSFELWFLLHFQPVQEKHNRYWYYKKLSEHLDCNYEKEAKRHSFTQKMYQTLLKHPKSNQDTAIKRAEKLFKTYEKEATNPADRCPCTTVYQLVKELNKYLNS